eukprot:Trichotokara_eunicae@DN981_c0_g1_i1.p1
MDGRRMPEMSGRRMPEMDGRRMPEMSGRRMPEMDGRRMPEMSGRRMPEMDGRRMPEMSERPVRHQTIGAPVRKTFSGRFDNLLESKVKSKQTLDEKFSGSGSGVWRRTASRRRHSFGVPKQAV